MPSISTLEASIERFLDTYSFSDDQRYGLNFANAIRQACPSYKFFKYSFLIIHTLERLLLDPDHPQAIRRLMIWCQPQIGKSTLSSRLFPAYYLRVKPTDRFAIISYGAEIALGLSDNAREYYKGMGGRLSRSSFGKRNWKNIYGGQLWAEGIGGSLTSKGYECSVIDDPLKGLEESLNARIKTFQENWYETDFKSRASNDAGIILTNTRWVNDDLCGRLLAKEKEAPQHWHILSLDALKEDRPYGIPGTCTVIDDWRSINQVVCAKRFSLATMIDRKSSMSEYFWNALYQQRPTEDSSKIYKVEKFNYYQVVPVSGIQTVIISVDSKLKETVSGSFVSIQVWALHSDLKYILLDLTRGRWGFKDTCDQIRAIYQKWEENGLQPSKVVIEEKANGPSIIEQLKTEFTGVEPFNPGSDSKVARARATENFYDRNEVWFPDPEYFEFMKEHGFVDELDQFPLGAYNDQVDASNQALLFLSGNTSIFGLMAALIGGD